MTIQNGVLESRCAIKEPWRTDVAMAAGKANDLIDKYFVAMGRRLSSHLVSRKSVSQLSFSRNPTTEPATRPIMSEVLRTRPASSSLSSRSFSATVATVAMDSDVNE